MSDWQRQLAQLSPERRALVEQKLAEKAKAAAMAANRPPPIRPVPRDARIPLSFAQQRLWFVEQLGGTMPAYNMRAAVRIAGPLDLAALKQGIEAIWQRHEVLRTVFEVRSGEPSQVVQSDAQVPFKFEDLSSCALADRDAELLRRMSAESRRPFDLASGPLLRVVLYRMGDNDHALLSVMHHIVSDAWSLGVFMREFSLHYNGIVRGVPTDLSPLSVQYADFAVWQRDWLRDEELNRQLAYWRRSLEGAPTRILLPQDRPRSSGQSSRGGVVPVEIDPELTRGLRRIAQETGSSLFMVLLAGYGCLLSRYSGGEDLLVGTPIANRQRPEVEPLIGFFVNTLVMRLRPSAAESFISCLRKVREASLSAYSHQDLPFEKLVEAVQPDRVLGVNPLCQVAFALQNQSGDSLKLDGLALTAIELERWESVFDLTLALEETAEGVRGVLEFSLEIFDPPTIRRMALNFVSLLGAVVRAPETPMRDLGWLDEGERRLLISEWNDTARMLPLDSSVPARFSKVASEFSDRIAIGFQNAITTYRDLDRRSNQLARWLIKRGVRRGSRVGLLEERCPDQIVAMLAILKAGAAYFPIDERSPGERIDAMLADSRTALLLVRDLLLPHGLSQWAGELALLGKTLEECGSESAEPLPIVNEGTDLAYVIFTSGSTGQPKGVAVPHLAILRLLFNTNYIQLGPDDRIAHLASVSFDAATFEIWGALLHGGRVELVRSDLALAPEEFESFLRERSITTAFLTTALFNQVARHRPSAFSSLRTVLFGGEAVDPRWVREVLQAGPPSRLLHVYGPTETTTFASWFEIIALDKNASTVPIGIPLSNTELYCLDPWMNPSPIGAMGELYIGGPGLAWGYLHHPDPTAARFVPHPFSSQPGGRLYRTGDLVRQRGDGAIEFCGRTDHQVKIRGFRIELGEIENVLISLPAVKRCVVMVREHPEKRIVAYVESDGNQTAVVAELRRMVEERLPGYMAPSAYHVLPVLPLNRNGKVDREALPEIAAQSAQPEVIEEELSETERFLAGIWSSLLGENVRSRTSNFFELGGHSLLLVQLISRIRDQFGVTISVRDTFLHPTLSALASAIDSAAPSTAADLRVIRRISRDQSLPLSHAQERLWFLHRLEEGSAAYNMPSVLRIAGDLDIGLLKQCLDAVVDRHEILRTRFAMEDGQPRQVILSRLDVPLGVVDLTHLEGARRENEVSRIGGEQALAPFNLEEGPLIRCLLVRLGHREHLLFSTLHHIISDGWSGGIWVRELSVLYQAFQKGLPSPLPPLELQYADFAAWQREWLRTEGGRQLDYWRTQLAGAPEVLQLPTDRPRPPFQTISGSVESFQILPETSGRMLQICRERDCTPFMGFLAAFAALLSRYSGQFDLVIGSPVANRVRSEIEPLIGFFVNTLALRLRLDGDPDFIALLSRARQTCTTAFDHQDLPFEHLVEALCPNRSLNHTPIYQVMFILQNAPSTGLDWPGLEVTPLESGTQTAKTDLTLALSPESGGWSGRIEYNTDLFDAATIRRFASHFVSLVGILLDQPGTPVAQLGFLSPNERSILLSDWNPPALPYASDFCLHHSFEAQVLKTPHAIAVSAEDGSLTYQELNQRSNRLAAHLQNLGAGPEVLIGICLDRGADLIVGMLAILKSGSAYVALDPAYPAGRSQMMMEDCRMPLLLTHRRLADRIPGISGKTVVIDDVAVSGAAVNPVSKVSSNNLAYLLYTSGSTGRPKGVAIQHRSVVALLAWARLTYSDEELRSVLAATSICFDLSVFEIFVPLSVGGKVVVVRNALSLIDASPPDTVSLINTVPSAIEELLRAGRIPESAHVINLAGEPLSPGLVDRLYALKNVAKVFDLYGPSEDTTYSTFVLRTAGGPRTIGRAIHNSRVYLVDRALQLVPQGVVGELCISGDGLARGYWERPDLTAERFIPDPFSETPGSRMYRTGDQARWLPDGTIMFLGRADNQVKVRGFRIELGEIETAIQRHPSVRDVVVIARKSSREGHDSQLAAYLVLHPGASLTAVEIQDFLRNSLPEFMVPQGITFLDGIPLNPNGKVDRQALPEPGLDSHSGFLGPRTPTEYRLCRIWEQILPAERVSVRDNFFAIGGHSLLAVRLIARIQEEFRQKIPLASLFQSPTIEQIAARLDHPISSVSEVPSWSHLVSLNQAGDRPPLFVIHPLGGTVLPYAELARHLGPDQPIHGLQALGIEPGQRPITNLDEMVRTYVELIRVHAPDGHCHLAGYSLGGLIAWEITRSLESEGRPPLSLTLFDMAAPSVIPDRMKRIDSAGLLASLFSTLDLNVEALRALPSEADQVEFVFKKALDADLIPAQAGPQDVQRYLALCRAHHSLEFPTRPIHGRLNLIRARELSDRVTQDPLLGWTGLAGGGVDIQWVDGSHETMLDSRHALGLAEIFRQLLDCARQA